MPYQLGRPMRARSRASNACQRCRKHKIKCTGVAPCAVCEIRGTQCEFSTPEDKISISASTFRTLKSRLRQLENEQQFRPYQEDSTTPAFTSQDQNIETTSAVTTARRAEGFQHSLEQDAYGHREESDSQGVASHQTGLSNPLVPEQPVYIPDRWGNLKYLGHSSTRSFSRQALLMISQSPNFTSTIPLSSYTEGDINNENVIEQSLTSADVAGLPSRELSLFYIQTVKFRTQPLYYLFDESDFVSNLHHFYEDIMTYAQSNLLWYVHYLLIMSLGKALLPQSQPRHGSYGSVLFERALRLLPNVSVMCRDFVISTEILCSIAIFLQSIDHRCASHIQIGQALRMAQMQGLHTDMQADIVGVDVLNRGRRLWWTVYTLDRRLSSSLGLPNALHDQDVTSPMASTITGDVSSTALAIHVRICQLLGRILSTVYSFDGTLNKTFLTTAKEVLKGIGGLADELARFADRCPGEISRVVAHLNLAYHQCIILTTRPMLFHLLKLRFESADPSSSFTVLSSTKGLVQACIDSAVQVALIISQLQQYDLLDTFLPFDLESVFSAAMVLVMAPSIHNKLLPEENHLAALHMAFDYMTDKGNTLASLRKAEVEELSQIRHVSKRVRSRPPGREDGRTPSAGFDPFPSAGMQQIHDPSDTISLADVASLPSIGEPFFDEWIMTDGLSGAQIMDLADALHTEDFDGEMDI